MALAFNRKQISVDVASVAVSMLCQIAYSYKVVTMDPQSASALIFKSLFNPWMWAMVLLSLNRQAS